MRANCSTYTVILLLTIGSIASAQEAMPWAANLDAAKQLAAQKNQLVMIHFWAPNCPPCRMLDATLFRDPDFAAQVTQNFVPVKVNAAEETALASQYGVDRWPQDVIILPSGQMVYRMVSKQEKEKDQYLAVLQGVAVKTAGMGQLASSGGPDAQPVSYPGDAAAPSASYSRFGAAPPASTGTETAAAPQSRFSAQPPVSSYAQQNTPAPAAAQPQSRFSTGYAAPNNNATAAAPASSQQPQSQMAQSQVPQQPSSYAAAPGQGDYATNPAPTQSRFAAQPSGASYDGGAMPQNNQPPAQPAPQTQDRFASQQTPVTPLTASASQPSPQTAVTPQSDRSIAPPAQQAPQQPQFALDGYCPVTLAEREAWQKGDARWGAVHQGRVYLFASDAHQRQFLASPDRFSPVLSGNDPVAYLEQGRLIEGNRSFGLTYNGMLYLFSSEESLRTFWNAPQQYSAQVQQAMLRNSQQLR